MADDIVTRLRVIYCADDDLTPCGTCLTCQAADEIKHLRDICEQLHHAIHCPTSGCPLDWEGIHNWQQYKENHQ